MAEKMDISLFLTGVILFAVGLVANDVQATIFMMAIGLGCMAAGLGREVCEDLYDTFKSIFEDLISIAK
jgi:hypothetical protein